MQGTTSFGLPISRSDVGYRFTLSGMAGTWDVVFFIFLHSSNNEVKY